MALGAPSSEILRLVIWGGMRPVLIGLAVGILASFALTRLIAGLLYRVSATDPLIFTAVLLVLALVAIPACWFPARRATQIDPTVTLHFE